MRQFEVPLNDPILRFTRVKKGATEKCRKGILIETGSQSFEIFWPLISEIKLLVTFYSCVSFNFQV